MQPLNGLVIGIIIIRQVNTIVLNQEPDFRCAGESLSTAFYLGFHQNVCFFCKWCGNIFVSPVKSYNEKYQGYSYRFGYADRSVTSNIQHEYFIVSNHSAKAEGDRDGYHHRGSF